jgi:hypothetical protein
MPLPAFHHDGVFVAFQKNEVLSLRTSKCPVPPAQGRPGRRRPGGLSRVIQTARRIRLATCNAG